LAIKEWAPMKTIQAFQTTDGKVFTSEEDAKKHEVFLSQHDVIDNFLKSHLNTYIALPQKSIARQAIINWELWKKENA
jgi:hypothetical protein